MNGLCIPALFGRARLVASCLSVVVVTLLPMAASAEEGDSFICEFKAGGPVKDHFPEAVGIVVGSEAEGTFVVDPIINYYVKEPLQAKVMADNDARLSLRWVVKITDDETGISLVNLQYDLTLLKKNMTARIKVKMAQGDTLEFSAPGTCVREKW